MTLNPIPSVLYFKTKPGECRYSKQENDKFSAKAIQNALIRYKKKFNILSVFEKSKLNDCMRCKCTVSKIRNKYTQKWNCSASRPISTRVMNVEIGNEAVQFDFYESLFRMNFRYIVLRISCFILSLSQSNKIHITAGTKTSSVIITNIMSFFVENSPIHLCRIGLNIHPVVFFSLQENSARCWTTRLPWTRLRPSSRVGPSPCSPPPTRPSARWRKRRRRAARRLPLSSSSSRYKKLPLFVTYRGLFL